MKINWKKFFCLALIIYLAFTVTPVHPTEFFVKNANEIETALRNVQPGDTLTMTNGVWTNQQIQFQGRGTANASILLRAETPGYVIINGRSNLRISGSYLIVSGLRFVGGESPTGAVVEFRGNAGNSDHCQLTHCAIVDYNPPEKSKDYKWVSLFGKFNRVDHCYFEGKTHSGTTLVVWLSGEPNYHLIDYNYFAHRPPLGMNGGETIRVGDSKFSMYDSYTTVEFNYFEQCNGETEIISSKSCENLYRYNTFVDCEGVLTLRHGNRCTVEGNFFFGNRNYEAGGVRIIGEDHQVINNYFEGLYGSGFRSALPIVNGVPNSPLDRYFQVKNALIAFNTFVDCRYTFVIGAGKNSELSLPPLNCTIANNVVYTSHKIVQELDQAINLTWEGNIMQGSSLGIEPPAGITLTDPELYLAQDSLWRPRDQSPVRGAAIGNYDFVTQDMDGQLRPEIKDVGADQISAAPVLRRPLTPAEVGPAWRSASLPVVLTVQKRGAGQVTVDPSGQVFAPGTIVTLTAKPDSGWKFVGWEGEINDTANPLQIKLETHLTVWAVFAEEKPLRYTLNVFVFSGGGIVYVDPAETNYIPGTVVTLTAEANPGWKFDHWEGDLRGNENPASVIMNADKMILAIFKPGTGVNENQQRPEKYHLNQNFPNPFNPVTRIQFALKNDGWTRLKIFNVTGTQVSQLLDQHLGAGKYEFEFNAAHLASGVYFYELQSGDFVAKKKMLLIR